MKIETVLDHLHSSITGRRYFQLFTVFTRCILALGFIPPSIPKIMHRPFTVLPESNPVGAYFSALYNTGFYYEFIGWSQIIAALLLLFPRTAHLGAAMFLPIIVNIAVLTCSVGFAGTWLLTILMSLAALWLNAWEYDRYKPLIFRDRAAGTMPLPLQWIVVPLFFALGGAGMAFIWWLIRLGNFSNYFNIGLGLAIAGVFVGLIVTLHYSFMPAGPLKKFSDVP